ncbi:hypothetical protein MMC27_000563, partial [Xylographa pallens]|nr:hypothetical protein [Xylographa pallens]
AQGEVVVFEAFEASPLSHKVLATENALQWDFPGSSVAIPYSEFITASFQESLAAFLEQASTESIKRFAARTNKAGSSAFESRDTVDPSLITQMLMTLLEANGKRVFPPLLRKRVRDEVCWTDGAEKPWRRCAYWLVLRVSMQRYLYMLHGAEAGRAYYKFLLCLVLMRLTEDALPYLRPELLALLKAKLARRLAKLEVAKESGSPTVRSVYESMFAVLRTGFLKTLNRTHERIEVIWNDLKNRIRKPVPNLPRRAESSHMKLTLPNSRFQLQQIMSWNMQMNVEGPSLMVHQYLMDFNASAPAAHQFDAFAKRYFCLSDLETRIEMPNLVIPTSRLEYEQSCEKLATKIDEYLNAVADAYDSNPEQKSIMLLTVIELWISMDRCVTALFELLTEYDPGIPPQILDVLQLTRVTDMSRLQKIQEYLTDRIEKCNFSRNTIFDDPAKGCFAERYFNESPDSSRLEQLYQSIEEAAEIARTRKEQEWRESRAKFEELEKKIRSSACDYITEDSCVVHDPRCTKCYLSRQSRRMRIQVHEHPLPSNLVQMKAVLFELGCPKAFAIYRDTTWRIIGSLAYQKQIGGFEPRLILYNYSELQRFINSTAARVTLGSTTKSFLDTHYRGVHFPVDLDQICLPHGLKWGYFDTLLKAWPGRIAQKLTFAHHCQIVIPAESPFSSLQLSADFAADSNGPSSYEVIASRTKCPLGLNIHEFTAYQTLFSGKHRRWLAISVELGSSNLNFSTEATTLLIAQLALQAGPVYQCDPLRTMHRFLRDQSLCRRLIEQINLRLDGISSNWHETNCMEMLLTLTLRLYSITSEPIKEEALEILNKARGAISKWIGQLRTDIHQSTTADAARKYSRYAFCAALLCKRTFASYATNNNDAKSTIELQPKDLECFIYCSITLQDNLIANPAVLPVVLKNSLIRDLKILFGMRFILRTSLEANPSSLNRVLNAILPQIENVPRSFSKPVFLPAPHDWWLELTIDATGQTKQQAIHYHLLEGHLFVDGRPVGKLPFEHQQSVVLEQLFGKQSLRTYPSGLRGMTYTLAFPVYGHQIHIGFRNNVLIVQACVRDTLLELIPQELFGGASNFDLPASLVENCVHWLDIRTGVIEIRQRPDIWKIKSSNWYLDCNARMARRRNSTLVDPHSLVFKQIANIFNGFEYRGRLTVFQPKNISLSVELRRLELSFFVNTRGLLECRQLRSEVEPNQDAGTWYGLNSKLVMRDAINWRQRSIIIPMGEVKYMKNDFHVAVTVENNGDYGRFVINDVLGRLDCAAEPRLLYRKAYLHACTSFVLPDPLTRRTGTEEALHCLNSGYCQPWAPLNSHHFESLMSIGRLTPLREYYPRDMKVMQRIVWNQELNSTIQDDGFKPVVEAICKKSRLLSTFAVKKTVLLSTEVADTPNHLTERGHLRRRIYQRSTLDIETRLVATDLLYTGRDHSEGVQARSNVFESVFLIRNRPNELYTTRNLGVIFQDWPSIGGYDRTLFDQFLLSDLLGLDFAPRWGSLVNQCRHAEAKDKYSLMFLFSMISFHADVKMDLVRTLIAFMILDDLKQLEPPSWPQYTHFRHNQTPTAEYLMQLIRPCCLPYPSDERSTFLGTLGTKLRRKLEIAQRAHYQQIEDECRALAQCLLDQWPCPEPTIDDSLGLPLVDMARALDIVRPEWLRFFQNMELSCHIEQVQCVLDRHSTETKFERQTLWDDNPKVFFIACQIGEPLTSPRDLLRTAGPIKSWTVYSNLFNIDMARHLVPFSPTTENKQTHTEVQHTFLPVSPEIHELQSIVKDIINSDSAVQNQYGEDLMQSLKALKTVQGSPQSNRALILPAQIPEEIFKARRAMDEQFEQLCIAFSKDDLRAQWLQEGFIWPCITPITILEQLRSTSTIAFGKGMRESIAVYGLCITKMQRLLRIEDAVLKKNHQRLLEEQKNLGHENWNPLEHCDWLLLEIDANILIRRDQVDVALATISPASGSNSVLQMNMGQGKTSCVIPMVSTVLADTKNLLRIVVPQPLLFSMAQLLQARLGGLIGRAISHIPFSRKTSTDSETIRAYYDVHKMIRASSGVIVALPEHILSFMLSGIQRLSDTRISEATQMIKVQTFMRKACRDILDESDFTLAVRTQLVYPSGSQTTVDGHPHRWETAEALLRLVEGHLWNLQQEFPQSIEVLMRLQGGFPVIFFLRKDVEDALIARLITNIVDGQTSILPTRECTKSDRSAIRQFISEPSVRPTTVERVRRIFANKSAAKQNVYLLRGLLVHRILLLTLKKRWNVQYGLHPNRDPIAVPFHARGCPSESAEFGHPDVAILFTCLAFYYDGLDLAQLRQSLEHVIKSDDPSSEYDRWTNNVRTLPDSLREWNAINIDDEAQLREIWQHTRYGVVVIDHFLNHFVFPKHAKQFRTKLSASGWDIPLFVPTSQLLIGQKSSSSYTKPLTTGFSGTNDNRTMLPLTIKQEDLRGLRHTNAEVLTYLLQPRSRRYVLASDYHGRHLSETELLQRLKSMKIKMFIDAGAQVLEMDNLTLVKTWLKVDPEAPAAVYFNAENKPFVLYRQGYQMPLLASPFAEDLGDCLVYLDEAHTRGTDLKMPVHAVGALTLSLGQTKDHTVQAAMRLRQLATSQSVVFFAPPEVHQSILDLRKKRYSGSIDSADVIHWLLVQTCSGIEQIQPLFFSHGMDFCRRAQAALDNSNFLADPEQRVAYLEVLKAKEQQSLEQLYKPRVLSKSRTTADSFSTDIAAFVTELNTRRRGFQDTGDAVHSSALQEVEQEREVAFEVEAVREVQKPVHHSPLFFPGLHKDILSFVTTGRLAAGCGGYEHAFVALRRTYLGVKYGISDQATTSRLYLSKEFTRTVSMPSTNRNSNFLRDVGWILWSVVTETALVIIPEEAELVIPQICDVRKPLTHLLTYAAPVTRKMLHFNNLTYYAMPPLPIGWKAPAWLTIELGIFDGRLYFEFEEYSKLQQYLGLRGDDVIRTEMSSDTMVPSEFDHIEGHPAKAADEAEAEALDPSDRAAPSFTARPLSFLQEWLALKRNGQDFAHTPMGYVCQGRSLNAKHPFFRRLDDNGIGGSSGATRSSELTRESNYGTAQVFSGNKLLEDDGSDGEEDGDGFFDEGELGGGEAQVDSEADDDTELYE